MTESNNSFESLNRLATILWWKRFSETMLYKAIDMACIAALLYFAKGLFFSY